MVRIWPSLPIAVSSAAGTGVGAVSGGVGAGVGGERRQVNHMVPYATFSGHMAAITCLKCNKHGDALVTAGKK